MIKVNDVFSIKKCNRGFELHEIKPTDHEKSKTGFKTDVTYHGSLRLIAMAIVEKSCGECKTGQELLDHIDNASMLISGTLIPLTKTENS